MKTFPFLFTLLILVLLLATAGSATAQTSPDLLIQMNPGLDGMCKADEWLPVRFTLENSGSGIDGELVVFAENGASTDSWRYAQEISLPSSSRKELTLYIFPNIRMSGVRAEVVSNDQIIAIDQARLSCLPNQDAFLGFGPRTPVISTSL